MVTVPLKVLPFPRDAFLKEHSVLAWAGEVYDADKLAPEKFLNFYKKTYISNNIK
ncbi:hypothetical protein SDAV_001523 [Spiroplasma phoeniceum P40]|uniref:Uncharacterized protein n=1 Tax=Spiroplasma phoeniceum P40 TaxID=1276259 RepID=A0A345DQJ7_9MOLU|nr:hypothetical protein SDAV_001523 [Spiroplasma phoeniceum P40]